MLRAFAVSTNVLCTRSAAINCMTQVRHSSRYVDIIFTETVPDLCTKGEQKKVKMAYARNMLFPRKLAVRASPEAIEDFGGFLKQGKTVKTNDLHRKVKKRLADMRMLQICRKANKETGQPDPITSETICEKLLLLKGLELKPEQIKLTEPIDNYRKPIPIQIEVGDTNFSLKVEMLP